MKTAKIAKQFDLDREDFDRFVQNSELKFDDKVLGLDLDDSYNLDDVIAAFRQYQDEREAAARSEERWRKAQREAAEAAAKAEQEAREKYLAEKQAALASMLVTSGFNFDGYSITKYSGYISGDDAVEVPREVSGLFGGRYSKAGDGLMAALVTIRRNALNELKEAAFALGCNAVIGVDFDYITLEPETATFDGKIKYLPYIVGVTANGNAVVIEKNE